MLAGLYQGKILIVRHHKGVVLIKADISSLRSVLPNGTESPWITPWAVVTTIGSGAIKDNDGRYGSYMTPRVGDNCIIGFEAGKQGLPYCIGLLPHDGDLPTEYDNDDYTNKDREKQIRQTPEGGGSEATVNPAYINKMLLQYFLMHSKTNHMVLDVAKADGQPEPRLEIGEDATNIGSEMALGRYFAEQFLKHSHTGDTGDITDIDSEEIKDYISEWAFVTKEPREDGVPGSETTPSENSATVESIFNSVITFGQNMCEGIVKVDTFLDDPIGSITDGVTDGLAAAVGDMLPSVDPTDVINEATTMLTSLGDNIETDTKSQLSDWAGVAGSLGGQLTGDQSAAMQTQIDGLDLSGLANFVNDGANKLLEMGDAAGITDTLTGLGSELLGPILDDGIAFVADKAGSLIGDTLGTLIPDVPFVDSALDLAAGLCSGNPGMVMSGLFGGLVDGLNVITGGVLTPFTDGIKAVGGGLLSGLFSKEGLPSGKELLDLAFS